MADHRAGRAAAAVLTVAAAVCCAFLLLGDHTSGLLSGAVPTFASGIVVLLSAGLVRVGVGPAERRLWRAVSWSATWLGAGLVAQAVLHDVLPDDPQDALMGVAFSLGAAGAAAFLYHGITHWNRFQTAVSDANDWLDGLSAVGVLAAGGVLVGHLAHGPMAGWSALQLDVWFLHVGALVMLLGTVVSVAQLGGIWRDRRIWMVLGVLAAAVSVSLAAGFIDDPLVRFGALQAVWVAVIAVTTCSHAVAAVHLDVRASTPQAPTVGALSILVAGLVVLSLNGILIHHPPVSVTLFATAGCLGAASRLTRLVQQLTGLARSQQEARTDHLTGVANRRGFSNALDEAVSGERRHAMLIVDLDRFKDINDRCGNAVGDEVLRTIARRLQSQLGDHDLLGRLGGDEFAVLMPDAEDCAAADVAHRLARAASEPVQVGGRQLRLGASIGVATTDPGERREGELMRRADVAMYAAKRSGGGVSVYDASADRRAQEERELLEDLRLVLGADASDLERRRVVVHYQPQVEVHTGAVVGVEALVRLQHPQRGLLLPDAFLELVERDGLMNSLTSIVLRRATSEARLWQASGHRIQVSVNFSTSCLSQPGLVTMVEQVCAESRFDPRLLTLELTETTLMAEPDHALAVVHQIAARGIGISIDDFGTGYSSLAYLTDLPARELKLDRSFTGRVLKEPRTASVVAGTIELAHHLGMRLVAEGVENDATLAVLYGLGCDVTQGFVHASPMPAAQLGQWLRKAGLPQLEKHLA